MLDFRRVQNHYITCSYTDIYKQIDGLAVLVQTQFRQERDEASPYLFCERRAGRIKALHWSGTGYTLYKCLMKKRFQWPQNEGELKKLSVQKCLWPACWSCRRKRWMRPYRSFHRSQRKKFMLLFRKSAR